MDDKKSEDQVKEENYLKDIKELTNSLVKAHSKIEKLNMAMEYINSCHLTPLVRRQIKKILSDN